MFQRTTSAFPLMPKKSSSSNLNINEMTAWSHHPALKQIRLVTIALPNNTVVILPDQEPPTAASTPRTTQRWSVTLHGKWIICRMIGKKKISGLRGDTSSRAEENSPTALVLRMPLGGHG